MFQVPQITDSIYYVGVNDRSKARFENMWELPHGVAYNSYLIMDEQVALVDTVDVCYSEIFFHKLDLVLKGKSVDYLIINHMEPDHSGSIGLLKQRYPNLKIVGNKKTFNMLAGYHGITENLVEVKTGISLKLGKHELSFIEAPMVHWPEVMFTYEQTDKVLFTADAFGTFGTLDGNIFDRDIDLRHYWPEMERYYACIVGKYGNFVQKALKKVDECQLDIKYVCSTHGPVWTEAHFTETRKIYEQFSRYEGQEGVVIIYGSMYGNTEVLADTIASAIASKGIKNVICHNVSSAPQSKILRDIFRFKSIVIGSPTYCNGIFSPIEHILELIRVREIKNRYLSIFGSCTWGGQAVKKLTPFAEEMGWELIGTPIEMKMSATPEMLNQGWELGEAIADKLISERN